MVDENAVENLIIAGQGYLADVRLYRDDAGEQQFLDDRGEQYRIEFPLQQAIQVCIDLAAHLVADSPGQRPSTLAGTFEALADRGIIDREDGDRLAAMARFRSLLVHGYADIVPERVWDIVSNHLGDIETYLGKVSRSVSQSDA